MHRKFGFTGNYSYIYHVEIIKSKQNKGYIMKVKTNNKITLDSKAYLSVNKGVFNSELLDRNDFVRMNNRTYYATLVNSRVHADHCFASM